MLKGYFVFSADTGHTVEHSPILALLPWWKGWNYPAEIPCPQQILSWGWAGTGHKKPRRSWSDTHRPGTWDNFSTGLQTSPQSCCPLAPGKLPIRLARSSPLNSGSSRAPPGQGGEGAGLLAGTGGARRPRQLISRCSSSMRSFRNSWASCWLYPEKEGTYFLKTARNRVGFTASQESGCHRAPITSAKASEFTLF